MGSMIEHYQSYYKLKKNHKELTIKCEKFANKIEVCVFDLMKEK
jgi:hypothetical protein